MARCAQEHSLKDKGLKVIYVSFVRLSPLISQIFSPHRIPNFSHSCFPFHQNTICFPFHQNTIRSVIWRFRGLQGMLCILYSFLDIPNAYPPNKGTEKSCNLKIYLFKVNILLMSHIITIFKKKSCCLEFPKMSDEGRIKIWTFTVVVRTCYQKIKWSVNWRLCYLLLWGELCLGKTRWSPKLQYLWMWPYLETGSS